MRASYTIDFSSEHLIGRTHPEFARLFGGKPPSPAAFSHWTRHGVRDVCLPSVMVGGRRLTTVNAIAWWIRETNAVTASMAISKTKQIEAELRREHDVNTAIAALTSPENRSPQSRTRSSGRK
jgi:hypothetical protein